MLKAQAVSLENDTLTITGARITDDPFHFGAHPLKVLRSYEGAGITHKTWLNRHVDNQIDTTFLIMIGPDGFEIYKTPSESFLYGAFLRSDNFRTKHGLKVGLTKKQFLEIMETCQLLSVPDHVRLKNKFVLEWIDFEFSNDTIREIRFKGYLD